MQAVILVGGEGTRLRPLTSTYPKPVVLLVDRPMMVFMLEWLRGHGVDDVIMCCGFKADKVRDVLGDGSSLKIRLRFVEEPDPRGTAGALKYAEDLLDDRFLMLNGDILTDLDLSAQMALHEQTGATGTLALVPVADPSSYGLVKLRDDGAVEQFLEKPSGDTALDTNLISAGAYVLERSVLDLIAPDTNVSIEREIWPALVDEGLYGFVDNDAYWMDVGTPARYLQATFDILEANVRTGVSEKLGDGFLWVDPSAEITGRAIPPAFVGARSQVAEGAHVGSLAVIGDDVVVGLNSVVERAVVLHGAQIGEDCVLRGCIIGPGARIGDRSQVIGGAMLGENVVLGCDNVVAHGARLFPGMEVPDGGLAF
ncbi:MAG TPA: NDP-sugar synthase [Solirubrobacteraceae bacterium]|nr:NDP-sugar synthase [Solirubrobacteraceae bacterium]